MGDASSLDQAVHGVWRLISSRALSELGNELPPPYGAEPRGLVQFQPNGRMMCVLADGRNGLDSSRAYLSYTGDYSMVDTVLSTVVDGSSDPNLLGKSQVRQVSLTDGLLKLTTPPVATDGDTVRRQFIWEKLASSV